MRFAVVLGPEAASCNLTDYAQVECLVSGNPLQPHVLLPRVLQPRFTVGPEPAVLVTQPVQRLLLHLELLPGLRGRPAYTSKKTRLTLACFRIICLEISRITIFQAAATKTSDSHFYGTSTSGAGNDHQCFPCMARGIYTPMYVSRKFSG